MQNRSVFLLWHTARREGEEDNDKCLGVFSSAEHAEQAVEGLQKLPGFRVHPRGFHIDEYEVDQICWTEGFIDPEDADDWAGWRTRMTQRDAKGAVVASWKDAQSDGEVWYEASAKNAYAYLFNAGEIVSDVWLFNVGQTPQCDEWDDLSKAPFSNSDEYVTDDTFDPSIDPLSDICVTFIRDSNGSIAGASIFIRTILHAVLKVGLKPGYCRLAKRAGPLAVPLADYIDG